MPTIGIAAEPIRCGTPVTETTPGVYHQARSGQPITGYAAHCTPHLGRITINPTKE
ncbi:MAG: hypothetical protein H6523_15320 [Mycolicibacterium sp.]|nr:hypothetical protein [Mycolicibacterium sp.]